MASDVADIPTFVILLESNRDRCAHVYGRLTRELPGCNIVPATERDQVAVFFGKERIAVSATLRPSKFACSASHFRVWKEIVAREMPYAIVLEDDVAVRRGFILFAQHLTRQLPSDFDLVHLYVSRPPEDWTERAANTDKLYISYIPKWGRSAYLVSRSGAEKLILGFQTITDSGDVQISEMARKGNLSIYCASKAYVDNLGQLTAQYKGERFRSTIW